MWKKKQKKTTIWRKTACDEISNAPPWWCEMLPPFARISSRAAVCIVVTTRQI